jgi:predicted dehydrogenase
MDAHTTLLTAPSTRRTFLAHASAMLAASAVPARAQDARLKVAVAGLVHGHVRGFLTVARRHPHVELVGIAEANRAVRDRYAAQHQIPAAQLFDDLPALLARTAPDVVAGFTNNFDHLALVQACAPRGVHVMVEKPLAVNLAHAREIVRLATEHRIHVLTQLETSWYPNTQAAWTLAHDGGVLGPLRKIVVMDGHPGPKEIGTQPEFFGWLSDPVKNGGGASMDFGCYGANLIAWLMRDETPLTVTATLQQLKRDPDYRSVDDEATIVVTYPQAQGIIQASWNWPYHRKDLEVYGEQAAFFSVGREQYQLRRLRGDRETHLAGARAAAADDGISYGPALDNLRALLAGREDVPPLASLAVNLRAAEILELAHQSAREQRAVAWPPAAP